MASGLDVFDAVVGAVGSGATVAAVVYAWKASRSAAEASSQAEQALAVARSTAVSSQAAAEAAERTVEAARAAHQDDERDRKARQLRSMGQVAEALFWKAATDAGWESRTGGWHVLEQNQLEQALVGLADELPETVALTQRNLPEQVMGSAASARIEVTQALKRLQEQQPPAPGR